MKRNYCEPVLQVILLTTGESDILTTSRSWDGFETSEDFFEPFLDLDIALGGR